MEILNSVGEGLAVALQPANLLYVVLGVLIGMVIGILPGLGPAPTIALLLPLTYVMPTTGAVIMLAGIYYGAYYGGTITSVLMRLPGEAATVVTMFDGHAMARQGRAGPALGISAIGSVFGGIVAVIGMILIGPLIADAALSFGPPEYAVFAAFGLVLTIYLGAKSPLKAGIAACIGLLIASVGLDSVSGAARFTFGSVDLLGGIDFIAVAMGIFGLGEILYNISDRQKFSAPIAKVTHVYPTKADLKESAGPIGRGSIIGFVLGMLPGGGGLIPTITSYGIEKKLSKTPERFGKGAIAGVAGPETANNAGSTSSFIPLLTLGIPPNVVLALIYGALLIQGITPGPDLSVEHPDIFWGVICSMVVGNIILVILSLPLVGVFVQMVKIRLGIISGVIIAVVFAGMYSVNNSMFDVWVMLFFGLVGYVMRRADIDPAPVALAMILGPILETSFRQSMLLTDGSLSVFVTRPIPLILIAVVLAVIIATTVQKQRKAKKRPAPVS